jgi:hypothetical protein
LRFSGSTAVFACGVVNFPHKAAIASSAASVFVSLALCHRHRDDVLASGPDISRYIMSVENYWHGLRPLSIIYVLPHALAIYGAIAFNLALVWSLLQQFGIASMAFILITTLISPAIPIVTALAFFDKSLDARISAVTDYVLDWCQNPFRKPPPSSDDEKEE